MTQAHLYHAQDFIAESIETLEKLTQDGSQTPATYRLLAKLYQHIGLPLLAELHHRQVITLAEAINDIEGQAAAQAGLGSVYATLNNKDEAIRWLERAGIETLGDTGRVSSLMERMAKLEEE